MALVKLWPLIPAQERTWFIPVIIFSELVLENGHSQEQLLWLAARNACSGFEYVFVDEAQFLTPEQVQELADMAEKLDIFCYGLKTDFQGNFFPGSAALLRLAEEIHEVPGGLCWCGAKATMNTRIDPEGNVVKKASRCSLTTSRPSAISAYATSTGERASAMPEILQNHVLADRLSSVFSSALWSS